MPEILEDNSGQEQMQETEQGLFDQLKDHFTKMFVNFSTSPIPYNGENVQYYLDPETKKYPLYEADGSVTTRQLLAVTRTLLADEQLDDAVKAPYAHRILALAYQFGVQNEELEMRAADLASGWTWETKERKADPETGEVTVTKGPAEDYAIAASDDGTGILYELPLAAQFNAEPVQAEDGKTYLWHTVLRTGRWEFAPAAGTPWNDGRGLSISKESLSALKQAFDDGAIEYVTVPDTHPSSNSENTIRNRGFIRKLEIFDDPERPGEQLLKAAFDFTNEDVKKAAEEGSIAGVSCGVKFDYTRKSDGKIFPAVLHHVALTNTPWIDGLGGWENLAASAYNVSSIIVGTEETPNMPETQELTLEQAQAEIAARDAELAQFRREKAERDVDDRLKALQTEKNMTPAVLEALRPVMLSAAVNNTKMLLFSDNGKTEVTLSDQIDAILNALPVAPNLTEATDTEGKAIKVEDTQPPATAESTLAHEDRVKAIFSELGLVDAELSENE